MSTFKNTMKSNALKNLFRLLIIGIILGSSSIHSQNTPNTDDTSFFEEERSITYGKLNELKKFVDYKQKADALDIEQELRIQYLDSAYQSTLKYAEGLEKVIIPSLENEVEKLNEVVDQWQNYTDIQSTHYKSEIKRYRRKRISIGPAIGYGYSLNSKQNINFGLYLQYTLVRF